jgi:hypothetical protein
MIVGFAASHFDFAVSDRPLLHKSSLTSRDVIGTWPDLNVEIADFNG